ncbi:hypothetical protein Hamer_G012691 [Homarus americanus]|uniref:Uncharacterized protein n=1 Tax=Homarus americanus TaxID=6706 RepID=A0A8J5JR42_HOMAM|nr:hypothetical protein Hamer_G012691 [Homarus americanus]
MTLGVGYTFSQLAERMSFRDKGVRKACWESRDRMALLQNHINLAPEAPETGNIITEISACLEDHLSLTATPPSSADNFSRHLEKQWPPSLLPPS